MSGTRGGFGRIVAMGVGLALALLLVAAAEARAGKYTVAQCGWYVGADAEWADTTGGAKFRPDRYCVPPGGGDPFDGSRVKSLTREGEATVSGTRYARWRWSAPAGTAITQVRGTWWQALHDGFEQRLGGIAGAGFEPFATATVTDTTPRGFVHGFAVPVPAIEERLLCARAEAKSCSLASGSWSALRALTITVDDVSPPAAGIAGELLGNWQRGPQVAAVWGADTGSGIRHGDTYLDGRPIARTEYACATATIGGELRAAKMQPCALAVSGQQTIATGAFSDGPHSLFHCVFGFDGDAGCTSTYTVHFDNTPPAHPRAVEIGASGWRRGNDFDLSWANPDQVGASPIHGAGWRLTGPGGYDNGPHYEPGFSRAELKDVDVPTAGEYTLQLWLRDFAGNEAPAAGATVALRFDDVAPTVAFAKGDGAAVVPPAIVASVGDAHSGPANGAISYRRADSEQWRELPTKLTTGSSGTGELRAPSPELAPGTYLFRAELTDAAGNRATTTLRGDGTRMEVQVPFPAQSGPGARTRLFARLSGGRGRGETHTVPFGAGAAVGGRLVGAGGAGLSGRELRVVSRPSRGALAPVAVETVRTGERGGFELQLEPGASRRISVNFVGEPGLEPSSRRPLELRVRSGVSLRVGRTRLTTGDVLRLSGEVRAGGAAIPRRGKLVAIQYLEQATRRWRPVVLTRSDHRGRFRARYRFRYVSGAAEVRLRATALAEERWPYAPGSSASVTIDVSGK